MPGQPSIRDDQFQWLGFHMHLDLGGKAGTALLLTKPNLVSPTPTQFSPVSCL